MSSFVLRGIYTDDLNRLTRFVRIVPEVLQTIIPRLAAKSGWTWAVIGGGPDPDKPNGAIRTVSFQTGQNPMGQGFDESEHAPVYNRMVAGYKAFCHSVFREFRRPLLARPTLTDCCS